MKHYTAVIIIDGRRELEEEVGEIPEPIALCHKIKHKIEKYLSTSN